VFYPKNDYLIVKYVDITKFVSLLQRKSLFFCRLDKLEDQLEGTTGTANFESLVMGKRLLRDSGFYTIPMPEEKINASVKKSYDNEKTRKSAFCVNCWNIKRDNESAALWKIYSDFNKGIMITSSIDRLIRSFLKTKEEIWLSEIKYIDHAKEVMAYGSILDPIIHKHKAYGYEEEVRMIHQKGSGKGGWFNDWSNEEVEEGVYLKVDINELMDSITISPYSPKWFFTLIKGVMKKYGLKTPILKSELSPN
jgi:hypothetical protein